MLPPSEARPLHTGLGARLINPSTSSHVPPFLPIIDFSRLSSPDPLVRRELAQELQDACKNSGFFYVAGHGVPPEVLERAFAQAKLFFDQELEKKMLVDMHKGASFKGYLPLKGEQVDPASRGDIHEAFDIGNDSQVFVEGIASSGNQFPPKEDLPEFQDAIEAAWDAIMDLGKRMFPIFALALDVPENYFEPFLTNPGSVMRVLHYPPQFGVIDAREIGIGAHSDYECFTLLAQDSVAALQVLNSEGQWVEAPPIPGTFVCNLGDQLQRWTNDVFKSTIHRAINRTGKERYSLPFFFGVDYETLIEVLPTCITPERPAKYEPIKAGEYVESRLAETYVQSTKGAEVSHAPEIGRLD